MFESLSPPCEKGLFVVLFTLGVHPASGGFPSKGVPVSSVRYPVSPPPHGTRCTDSRCCCSACGGGQQGSIASNIYIYTTNYSFAYRLLYNMHKYLCCNYAHCTNTIVFALIPVFCPHLVDVSGRQFTAPAVPLPEAPARPCAGLRSAALTAAGCLAHDPLGPVPSLPCHTQPWQRRLSSRSFLAGCAVC